jgi:hypothetical protein
MKKETLEEVAERLTNDFPALEVRFNMTNEEIYGWFLEALQKGAKWQQEIMYTEEDMIKFMQFIVSEEELENTSGVSIDTAKYFLNKFKNK